MRDTTAHRPAQAPARQEGHHPLARQTALVIDHSQSMRSMLGNLGAQQVDVAADCFNALQALKARHYDIVLCEYHLGQDGRTGQHLLEEARLRGLVGLATVWIMVSGERELRKVMSVIENEPDDYLLKPVSESTLLARLRAARQRRALFARAGQLMKRYDYVGALRECDALARRDGIRKDDVWRVQARLYLEIGDHAAARAVAEQALAQRQPPWALLVVARCLHAQGEYRECCDVLQRLIRASPGYLEAYDLLGASLLLLDDADGARRIVDGAVSMAPESAPRQELLADAALRQGDFATAETSLGQAIQLTELSVSKRASPYFKLTDMLLAQERQDEALAALARTRRVFDDQEEVAVRAVVRQARILQDRGETDKAGALMREAGDALGRGVALPAEELMGAATLLLALDDADGAAALFGRLVRDHHTDQRLLEAVCDAYAAHGRREAGEQLVRATVEMATQLNNEGVSLYRNGDVAEAVRALQRAGEAMPGNTTVLLNQARAMVKLLQREPDQRLLAQAQDLVMRIRRMDPGLDEPVVLMKALGVLRDEAAAAR